MSCCDARGCDQFFSPRFARRVARRYRKRGLDRTAGRMVAFLEQRGLAGATVLEIGGGVGEIGLELLKRGADRVVTLELSPAYEAEAVRLARDAGLEQRVERRIHDIAADPEAVAPADIVVLHRVVCCYPDYRRLLGAASGRARSTIVFSHPRRNLASRTLIALENLGFRLRGRDFRTFAHPPAAMADVCRQRGFARTLFHPGRVWQVQGLTR